MLVWVLVSTMDFFFFLAYCTSIHMPMDMTNPSHLFSEIFWGLCFNSTCLIANNLLQALTFHHINSECRFQMKKLS